MACMQQKKITPFIREGLIHTASIQNSLFFIFLAFITLFPGTRTQAGGDVYWNCSVHWGSYPSGETYTYGISELGTFDTLHFSQLAQPLRFTNEERGAVITRMSSYSIFKNGVPIVQNGIPTFDNSTFYQITEDGTYDFIAHIGWQADIHVHIVVDFSDMLVIPDSEQQPDVSFFLTSFNQLVFKNLAESNAKALQVFDIMGNMIYSESIASYSGTYYYTQNPLESFVHSIYIWRLLDENSEVIDQSKFLLK